MFGSQILEVLIGVIFVFILVSVMTTAIREGLEGWLKMRAGFLEYGIRELLHDAAGQGLTKSLFNHPFIFSLFSGQYVPQDRTERPTLFSSLFTRGVTNLPSYIPAKNFSLALLDIVARGPVTNAVSSDPHALPLNVATLRTNILSLQNEPVQRLVLAALDNAQGDLGQAQQIIEAWYNSAMDRVSGWYRRSTQGMVFCIGLLLACGLNINAISLADYLYRHDAVRTALVKQAEVAAANPAQITFERARDELDKVSLPIGWGAGWGAPKQGEAAGTGGTWNSFAGPVLGWLITALAAMLGAPFWFDVLNKIMVLRSTVKPHEKSPEEQSKDRPASFKPSSNTGSRPAGAGAADAGGLAVSSTFSPLPSPADPESEVDGCDVEPTDLTPDEDLPAARGGVA